MNRKRVVFFLSLGVVVSAFLIVGFSLLSAPSQLVSPLSDEEVLAIGVKYVEETYGTDYTINGDVTETTYTEVGPAGEITFTYLAASFRVPADYQKPGTLVNILVDPETGEIVKVLTNWSKSMPPTNPPQ
jgi:hypothetical protein